MYSTAVIEKNVASYEKAHKLKLLRIDEGKCADFCAHLDSIYNRDERSWKRDLSREESAFITNELIMSMLDFHYWSARYATIQKDGGGVCKFSAEWESQAIALRLISKLEEAMVDKASRGESISGLLIAWHKARQLGATALGRLITTHRVVTQKHRRAMAASVDDDKIQELYDRDKLIIDNLPVWMAPKIGYDEKRSHIYFDNLDSRVIYQVSSQKSGVGVGRQFELSHLTELSTWDENYVAKQMEVDFFPTIPQSILTLAILESTAFGRGNWWHDFSERVRKGLTRRWAYLFVPWYAEPKKYRDNAPVDWNPLQESLLHAQKVYDTSLEFIGKQVMLSRDQLFWYESTRLEYQRAGRLNFFLTNYCATPEESFQHSSQSAFSAELIDEIRLGAKPGAAYEVRLAA